MEEEYNLDHVARKSIKGVFALTSRTFLIQILGVVASLVLALYLSPADFGIFFIVSSIVVFLNYFADIGLAAALIQKKEAPTLQELRIAFTIQQAMVLAIIVPAFLLSPFIENFFHINQQGIFLFYAFLVSFLLSSLKTIPTVLLERDLDFHKLVIPQVAENLVYNLALIILAVKGFGIESFTVAVLLRGIVGLVLMYWVKPWSIGLAWDLNIFKKLLKFGLPFQMNSFLGLIKDDLINVYIGRVLPLAEVGYIGFAQKWAYMPLRLVMDNVIKIIFPSISRLQHDEKSMKTIIEKSLFVIALFIIPTAVGIITLSHFFVEFIPKYSKWEPALFSLTFFALNTIFGSLSTPITNFLYAIGKSKVTLYFMAAWTTLIWLLTPLFIHLFGFNGVSIASFLVALSTLAIYFEARRHIKFSFIKPVIKPFFVAGIMFVFILITESMVHSFVTLFIEMALASFVYLGLMFLLARAEVIKTIAVVRQSLRKE